MFPIYFCWNISTACYHTEDLGDLNGLYLAPVILDYTQKNQGIVQNCTNCSNTNQNMQI